MKKLVTLLLALSLVLSMCAFTASADEYVKLTWAMGSDSGDAPADKAIVEEAMNVIFREKLGCELETIYITNEKLQAELAAGGGYDMYFTCDWWNDYGTKARTGLFADLTEAVKEITPALYATMPEMVWEGAKVDGKIFAIPVNKDYCPEIFLRFPKEFFAEKGMEIPYHFDFLALEPYLKALKEVDRVANPDFAPYPLMLAAGFGGIDGIFNYTNREATIGMNYENPGDPVKIISVYEDPAFIARLEKMHEWYKAGYINPDAATTQAGQIDGKLKQIKLGQGFYGADSIWSAGDQFAQQIARISGPYLSASGVRGSMNAIDALLQEDEPEKFELALKVQELVNTDKQIRDMLRYGVEGTHFNYNTDGTVTRTEQGRKSYGPWAFSQGSYALSSIEGSSDPSVVVDPQMWAKIADIYAKEAITAPDFGFSFDPSDFEEEISAIKVVSGKYWARLTVGELDPAVGVPECLEELRKVGLDTIIAGAQEQLDAFLAAK